MTELRSPITAFVPFYHSVVPGGMVESALRAKAAAVVDPQHLDQMVKDIWKGLVARVERHAFRTLIGEFDTFRESHGLPRTADSDEALRRFERHLEDTRNCRRILGAYPVLKQRLQTLVQDSLDAYAEVLHAYAEDLGILKAAGLVTAGGGTERLTEISLSGSDLHNESRQVVHVRLSDGSRLVFKPRTLVPDAFVLDLYTAADPYLRHSLRRCVPASVTCGAHGWQQFVATAAMESPEQASRYFYRFGALCAVFGAIGASDLHHENLLAHGEHPCVIDTETVLRPDTGAGGDTLPKALRAHLQLSVATTMLVPMVHPSSYVDVMLAGVGVAQPQSSNMKRPVVRDKGTDNISVDWQTITYQHRTNVPRLGDAPLSATDHYRDIVAGYTDALGFVRSEQIGKVLDKYPDMPVRCVVRSTMVYARFVDASTHPDYLARPEEADRLLRLLKGVPDHLSPEAAEYVSAAERASLATGNIPYFMSRSDTTEIATLRTRFPGAYRGSPLELARAGVALNAARADVYHHFLLEETFSEVVGDDSTAGLSAHSVFGQTALHQARPSRWWPLIADRIRDIGVTVERPGGTETGWVCGVGPGGETPTLAPGLFVSFHDSGGIVAFLERASRYDRGLRDLYLSADRGLASLVSAYGDTLTRTAESVFSGTSSLLLSSPLRLNRDALERVLDQVDQRSGTADLGNDLAAGPAGLLMLLLSRMESDGSSALCSADRLAKLRDLVLAQRAPRTAAWFDVAHGELGLRWACSRIGRVLDDPRLVRQSADWLTARLTADAQPSSTGWCKGTAGLLLCSAEILSAAGREDWLSGARLASLVGEATRLPASQPVDLSVCHGSSGVIQSLIATGRVLGDAALLQQALDHQERVIERIRTNGFRTGAAGRTSLLGYMLGWSGIGDTDVMLHSVATGRAHELDDACIPVALSPGCRIRQPC